MWRCSVRQFIQSSSGKGTVVASYGVSTSLFGCLLLDGSGERPTIFALPAVGSETPTRCAIDATGSSTLALLRMFPVLPTPINPLRPLLPRYGHPEVQGRRGRMPKPEAYTRSEPKLFRAQARKFETINHKAMSWCQSSYWPRLCVPMAVTYGVVCATKG